MEREDKEVLLTSFGTIISRCLRRAAVVDKTNQRNVLPKMSRTPLSTMSQILQVHLGFEVNPWMLMEVESMKDFLITYK